MNENHSGPVGSGLRLVGKKTVPLPFETVHIGINVIGLEAEVMQTASTFLKIRGNRTSPLHGVDQFDLSPIHRQKHRRSGLRGNIFPTGEVQPKVGGKSLNGCR
tara:strand:+ start:2128 stop:2439 length:312 start_codon:yes stop_codon:yes gene_type:complete